MSVAFWNTEKLSAAHGGERTGRAVEERAEGVERRRATTAKLEFLEEQMKAQAPSVLFLSEVQGNRSDWDGGLRKWLQKRGYRSQLVAGEGGRNGVLSAWREEQVEVEDVKRLDVRVVGVAVRARTDRHVRRIVCMHGLHEETKQEHLDEEGKPVGQCFARQLLHAEEWVECGEGGGVVCGDLNRVMCAKWRVSGRNMCDDDRAVARMAGWQCSCCGGTAVDGRCMIGQGTAMTRWDAKEAPSARLDYAIAVGREAERWERVTETEPWVGKRRVSDHAYVGVALTLQSRGEVGERREMPFPLAGRRLDKAVKLRYGEKLGGTFARRAEAAVEVAAELEESAVAEIRERLVGAARDAVSEVGAERGAGERRRTWQAEGQTPKQRYQQWAARLGRVLVERRSGLPPPRALAGELEHCKRLQREWVAARGGVEDGWARITRKCRGEVRRAGRAHKRAETVERQRLREMAEDVSRKQMDAAERMQRVWRHLRERRAAAALDTVWEGDKAVDAKKNPDEARRRRVRSAEEPERFKKELGKIGRATVKSLSDTPACEEAFRAWGDVFSLEWEELRGTDGGDFDLVKELTYPLFKEVLASMPSGKAVGAGRFHAELLWQADERIKRAFYKALLADLKNEVVPKEWKVVLYALLVKPPPNDPTVIAERREIALMAHEMKLLLQMVRRVSYQRIVGRVLRQQLGWIAGFGCTDPSLVAAVTLKQARRLGARRLYMLFIDLATFFPRIDRGVVTIAEMLAGVPREVRELTLRIYGCAGDEEGAVQCRYDSAGGLGASFGNDRGALMGCVLSPDRAKILLNSLVVAINLTCSGVRLWGHGDMSDAQSWKRVMQAAFADDWWGAFETEKDLRRAWAIWRSWEAITGSKLGVKKALKTVVTGVRYEEGRILDVEDPLLRLRGGGVVPFIRNEEPYKHLGNMRCANGDDKEGWTALKRKLRAALARLRRMQRPSVGEFMMVSNALLGGLAGYYLQTLYITFEQAEEVEREWRTIFRRKFGYSLEEVQSKPRAYFYQARGKTAVRREHLWAVGLAAIATCFANAVADVEATPQRDAARSEIALAMERWGCCTDPGRWSWEHLAEAIELSLRRGSCRQLGDAWMLAIALLEKAHREEYEFQKPEASAWTRDFGTEQRERWGRWRGRFPEGDPLSKEARHWEAPRSKLLHEPARGGGLGLPPEACLLAAGVKGVGHMCVSYVDEGGRTKHKYASYRAACARNRRLPRNEEGRRAWERQVDRMRSAGVMAAAEEAVLDEMGGTTGVGWADARPAEWRVDVGKEVRGEAVEGLLRAMEEPDVRARRSREVWRRQLTECFSAEGSERVEWVHGGRDRMAEARGARCVVVEGAARDEQASGGEARWMLRGKGGAASGEHDEEGIAVGEDGWAVGWEAVAEALKASMDLDEEGFAVDEEGVRFEGEKMGELEPALQMAARARWGVHAHKPDVPVEQGRPAEKYKETTINLDVARQNLRELCKWQARVRATAVYSVDGTRTAVKRDKRPPAYVVGRAAVRHDGVTLGGGMHEPEGADNYLAELAAQIDALHHEAEGGRVIVVFDATSPVWAMRKFTRQCHRRRQGRYAGEWLEALMKLVDRMEVVVFLWQRSHMGSTVNEWADLEADAAAQQAADNEMVDVERVFSDSYSTKFTLPRRSMHEWAAGLACRVVDDRLAAVVVESQVRDEFDMTALTLPDATQRTCEAVLCERCVIGDAKRIVGAHRVLRLGRAFCPFGCRDSKGARRQFTWWHAAFQCTHDELVEARREWHEQLVVAAEELQDPVTKVEHDQAQRVVEAVERELPKTRRGAVAPRTELAAHVRRIVQRFVGGLVRSAGSRRVDASTAVRRTLVTAMTAGAKVLQKAQELTRPAEKLLQQEEASLRKARKYAQRWRRVTSEAGPARAAALKAVHQAKERVSEELRRQEEVGTITAEEAGDARSRLATEGSAEEVLAETAVGGWLASVRAEHGRVGAEAYWRWRLVHLVTKWRLVAGLRAYARGRSRTVGSVHDEEASELLAVVLGAAGEVRQIERVAGGEWEELAIKEKVAWGRYEAGGRRGGVLRRRREARKRQRDRVTAARQREEEAMARGMKRYLEQQGLATVGVSGRVLEAVGDRWVMEVARRKKARVAQVGARPRKMSAARRAFEEGWAPDRWNRWKVERVLEVRRLARGGRGLEGRIRWAGKRLDTGLPWQDSWEILRDMEGRVKCSALCMEEAGELEELRYGVRARRAATVRRGSEGRSERAPCVRKWRGRLRGGLAAWQREEEAEKSWWMAEEMSEEEGVKGEVAEEGRWVMAMADARKRRMRSGGTGRGRQRRRVGVVVSSEEEESEEEGAGGADDRSDA